MSQRMLSVTCWFGVQCNGWGMGMCVVIAAGCGSIVFFQNIHTDYILPMVWAGNGYEVHYVQKLDRIGCELDVVGSYLFT